MSADINYVVQNGDCAWIAASKILKKDGKEHSNSEIVNEMSRLAKVNGYKSVDDFNEGCFAKVGTSFKTDTPSSLNVKKNPQTVQQPPQKSTSVQKPHTSEIKYATASFFPVDQIIEWFKKKNQPPVSPVSKKPEIKKPYSTPVIGDLKKIDEKNAKIADSTLSRGEKIVKIAENEMETKCTKNNKGFSRYTGTSGYQYWCTNFVSHVVNAATKGNCPFGNESSTIRLRNWAKKNNKLLKYDPNIPTEKQVKPGDIILMKQREKSGHAAIVTKAKDNYIYTVEGGVSDKKHHPEDERVIKRRTYKSGEDITDNVQSIEYIIHMS
jgi:hypothetical protein